MKSGLLTAFLMVVIGLVAGCGQKGSLYRDAPTQSKAEPEVVSADQATSDDKR